MGTRRSATPHSFIAGHRQPFPITSPWLPIMHEFEWV